MENKKFKPYIDKLFAFIAIPVAILLAALTLVCSFDIIPLLIVISVDLFTLYFLISPLFGYVELRESSVFIKFGFILKKEIPYEKIRAITKERKFYADSMLSLKNSLEHVNIKYNTFDIATISVVTNEEFIEALDVRCGF